MNKKDYKYYKIEDFLTDEEFRSWVLRPNQKLDYFWTELMDSFPDKKPEILKSKEMLLILHFNQQEVREEEKDGVLRNIIQNNKSPRYTEEIKKQPRQYYLVHNFDFLAKIAASLLILIGSVLFVWNNIQKNTSLIQQSLMITKSNPAGKKLTFKLPDGSNVTLNSESSIDFPDYFENSTRTVKLQGEAYFDVVHDENKPFIVLTGDVITKVLGTSFNVSAFLDDDVIAVSLVKGQVKVIVEGSGLDEEIFLEPSEKAIVNRQTRRISKVSFDSITEVGWKDGILVFDGDDYQKVLEKLERWYGVQFDPLNTPVSEWKIKGRFKDMNLTQLLEHFKFTHKIEYKIENKNVEIRFN